MTRRHRVLIGVTALVVCILVSMSCVDAKGDTKGGTKGQATTARENASQRTGATSNVAKTNTGSPKQKPRTGRTKSASKNADPAADLAALQRLTVQFSASVGLSPDTTTYMLYALLAVFVLSFVNKSAANLRHRVELWCLGVAHMFLSQDGRWNPKKQPDPELVLSAMSNDLSCSHPTRRIIFIRHGESCWNEVFNRGFGPSMLVRLAKSIFKEALCVFGDDSVYLDSPLSSRGIEQVESLSRFVSNDPSEKLDAAAAADRMCLRGEGRPSVVASSNLRRAIATVCIGLWTRLKQTSEKVYILSSCQEGSRNVDCVCLAGPGEVPPLKQVKKKLDTEAFTHMAYFNADFNFGNKPIFGSGLDRLNEFAAFCMMPQLAGKTIIVGGHSLWFRTFFRTFLPRGFDHVAKDCKMANAGVVGFTLTGTIVAGKPLYRVDPKSLTEVFGPQDPKKNPNGRSFLVPTK